MRAIIWLALKDLRLLWRDKFGMFWVLGFPLMFALFFGSIFGGRGGKTAQMALAVVDEDRSAESAAFIERLGASESLEVDVQPDVATARELVIKSERVAYVRLVDGFGEAGGAGMFGGQGVPIEVGIDPARKAESGFLQGLLVQAAFEGMREQFSDPKKMKEQLAKSREEIEKGSGMEPDQQKNLKKLLENLDSFYDEVEPETMTEGPGSGGPQIEMTEVRRDTSGRPHTSFEVTFPSAMIWGVLGCVATFAIGIVTERIAGTLMRLRLSPLSRSQILAGKGLACFTASVLVILVLLGIGMLFFGVRVASPVALALAVACNAICFVGMMMAMSVLGKTEQAVAGSGWAIIMVMTMSGGAMIPLIAMPDWMLKISNFSPIKWGILALEGAIWRSFTLTEMLLPCGILLGVGVTFFVIGATIFSRSDR